MSVSGYGPLANRTEDGLAKSFERRGVFDGAGHMIDHSDRWLSSLACIVLLGPGLSAQPPSSPPPPSSAADSATATAAAAAAVGSAAHKSVVVRGNGRRSRAGTTMEYCGWPWCLAMVYEYDAHANIVCQCLVQHLGGLD